MNDESLATRRHIHESRNERLSQALRESIGPEQLAKTRKLARKETFKEGKGVWDAERYK